jgi:hypothetical protein
MASPCTQLTTYTNILDLPRTQSIDNGDFLIVETPDGTTILDFEDFIIPVQNTTLGDTLSTLQTDIDNLNSLPVFRSTINSNTVLSSTGVSTKVVFGSLDYDTNSNFSVLSSRFTATTPGYYIFNTSVGSESQSSTNTSVAFRVNNTTNFSKSQSPGYFWSLSDIYYLNTSDYVEVFASTTNATNITLSSGSFSGYFLRPQ